MRGIMGFRLLVGRRKVGALNLFSDTPDVFDEVSVERAILLAAFASVAANAVAQGDDVATLQRGVASNREIGKAIGMLMALNGISEVHAFDMLRRISQDTNVKLAEIAAAMVQRHVRSASDEVGTGERQSAVRRSGGR